MCILAHRNLQKAIFEFEMATIALNGWFPCAINTNEHPDTTISDSSSNDMWIWYDALMGKGTLIQPECGEFIMPLCHSIEICSAPSSRTVSIFVKRILAVNLPENAPRKALWILQGGPGVSSVSSTYTLVPKCTTDLWQTYMY